MKAFHREIRDIIAKDKITIIDAITQYCELKGIEVEEIVSLVSPSMKADIHEEAIHFRYIKKPTDATLDI